MSFRYLLALAIIILLFTKPVTATTDPRTYPNNKFGINILSPEADIDKAAELVNSNGDWGWVVITIKKDELNLDRWQSIFNYLRVKHLIPIVRITTVFDLKGYWQRPTDEDASKWADFLSKLNWPTKNRYVQIYNEVNSASEWGGSVDPASYAQELNKTIEALKSKNSDFFVLSAPLDLSLNNSPSSLDAQLFYNVMAKTVPQIFTKLDGWASHSYPNPGFIASPQNSGRTAIDGYNWELSQVGKYLNGKSLPIFITETGWKRENSYTQGLSEDQISDYFKTAFENIWNSKNVVLVAPFVLNYPDPLYQTFSFINNDKQYKYFTAVQNLTKASGQPPLNYFATNLIIYFIDLKTKSAPKLHLVSKTVENPTLNSNQQLNINLQPTGFERSAEPQIISNQKTQAQKFLGLF